jgi:hypothetical protein
VRLLSIPEEIEGKCSSSFVGEEYGFSEGEDILPFNFDIALSLVKGYVTGQQQPSTSRPML